jgi:hypothetical protein
VSDHDPESRLGRRGPSPETTPVLRSVLVLTLGLFGECSALMMRS